MAVYLAMPYITKGSRIRAQWLQANPFASLAGMQMKASCTAIEVVGVVRHIRAENPNDTSNIRFYVDPEGDCQLTPTRPPGCTCPSGHIEIKPSHVCELLPCPA